MAPALLPRYLGTLIRLQMQVADAVACGVLDTCRRGRSACALGNEALMDAPGGSRDDEDMLMAQGW